MNMAILSGYDIYIYIDIDISYILGFSWMFRGYVPFRDKGPHTRVSRAVASPTTVVLPQVVI